MDSTLQTASASAKQHIPHGLSKLWVPEYANPRDDFFLSDYERTRAWISGLPMANVSETASQVLDALVDFNRQAIPNQTRIKIVELFSQPVRYIRQNLEKYYIDAAFPLTAKSRRSVKLSQELYAELALSYKICVLEAYAGRGKNSKRLVAFAIHRAIIYLSEILHLTTLEYEQYPERVWGEIHFLYALAVKNSVHRLPIQNSIEIASESSCIGDLYKRLLLYALASPCYLRQRENQLVYSQLLEWTNFARLTIPDTIGNNSGHFLVRLSSDAPPNHLSFEKKKLSKRCRILDTQWLVAHLQELLLAFEPNSPEEKLPETAKLSKQTLEHLIVNLGSRPRRKFSRTQLGYSLKLTVGVPNIHSLVKTNALHGVAACGKESKDKIDWLDQHFSRHASSLSGDSENNWGNSSNLLLDLGAEADSSSSSFHTGTMLEDNVQSPWAMSYSQPEIKVYECKTRDESAGGYCIDWGDANAPKIKPGELIGIQSHATGKHFGVAATRWIKNISKHKLRMGVQLIAPNSFAVEVRLDADDTISCVYSGLLVPESKFANIPLSLIVPTHSYQKGDILWINGGNNELRICLTEPLNTTPSFVQYQIAYHS